MISLSFTKLCLLFLFALFIPTTIAQSATVTRANGTATRQARDFQRVVKVLINIVENIQDDGKTNDGQTDDVQTDDFQTDDAQADDAPADDVQTDDVQTDDAQASDAQTNNIKQLPASPTSEIPSETFEPSPADEIPSSPEPHADIPEQESPYNLHIVEPRSGKADAAVIVLHGLGQSVDTLLPIAHALSLTGLPNIRFIIPEAPKQHVTAIDQTVTSWFDIASKDPSHPENREEILKAAANIAAIRDLQMRDHAIPAHRVAVLGLSQGGALALTAYLRYRWAGVMTVSSWLPLRDSYPEEMTDDSADAKLLMVHGSDDQMVPKELARLSADLIKEWGRNVSYVEIEGEGHWLSGAIDTLVNTALAALREALS